MPLTARFTVDRADPVEVAGLEGDWVGVLLFAKTFTSGIVGSARTLFMTAGAEGDRSYAATEQIAGSVDGGAEGTVVVQHGGRESGADGPTGHVVANSGTGGFAGWSGSLRIEHDEQGPYFVFDL